MVAALISLASIVATISLLPKAPARTVPKAVDQAAGSWRTLVTERSALNALVLLALYYLSFGMFFSEVALVLNARLTWHGRVFGPQEVGVAFTVAGAINVVVQLFLSKKMSLLVGEHRLSQLSLLILAAGYAGVGFATDVATFWAALIVASLGMALARPSLVALLSFAVPQTQQGIAMGVNQSLMAIANIVAPIAAGILIANGLYGSWTSSIAGLVLIAALVLTSQGGAKASSGVAGT